MQTASSLPGGMIPDLIAGVLSCIVDGFHQGKGVSGEYIGVGLSFPLHESVDPFEEPSLLDEILLSFKFLQPPYRVFNVGRVRNEILKYQMESRTCWVRVYKGRHAGAWHG